MVFIFFLKKITFFRVKHMVLHSMFFGFLNALPHSIHVTAMMFCNIPSQEQPFLAFYAYTLVLLSFLGVYQNNFDLNSNQIVFLNFNSPAIRAKDLFLVQTWLCIGVS